MTLSEIFAFGKARRRQYQQNLKAMRQAVEIIGKEYEQKPYDELLLPAEQGSTKRVFDGHMLSFSAEAFNVNKDGDVGFCVDAAGLPTLFEVKPSYQFWKRKDGSIHY